MKDNITNLLNQIKIISRNIKERRKEKAKKGENFNIFNDLGIMSDEVHLHSSFIATLLNPKASHGQADKYLCAFMDMLHNTDPHIDSLFVDTKSDKLSVQVEKSIGKLTDTTGGRIDLYLTDWNHRIIIENKIYAGDQHNQMLRYWNYGLSKDSGHTNDTFILIYLTLDGHAPSSDSLKNLNIDNILCLSYKHEIRAWLIRCLELSANQPLIRETINQYINTIDLLTNSNMDQNQELLHVLSKEEHLDAVFDIMNSRDSLLNYMMNEIFIPELKKLAEEKGFALKDISTDWVGESWAGAIFYNDKWKNFRLAFEFERRGMGELIFGFVKKPDMKRNDISNWKNIQDAYSSKDRNNQMWIYKDFIGNRWWGTAKGMKDLLNGKTLQDFSDMIDEAVMSVEGLSL